MIVITTHTSPNRATGDILFREPGRSPRKTGGYRNRSQGHRQRQQDVLFEVTGHPVKSSLGLGLALGKLVGIGNRRSGKEIDLDLGFGSRRPDGEPSS